MWPARGRLLPQGLGIDVQLSFEQQQQVREFVEAGYSDEQIAQAMVISVKQVRPIRLALEASMRPR